MHCQICYRTLVLWQSCQRPNVASVSNSFPGRGSRPPTAIDSFDSFNIFELIDFFLLAPALASTYVCQTFGTALALERAAMLRINCEAVMRKITTRGFTLEEVLIMAAMNLLWRAPRCASQLGRLSRFPLRSRLMCGLTLQEADAIVQGALAKARELKCSPMTVVVVDAAGVHCDEARRRKRRTTTRYRFRQSLGVLSECGSGGERCQSGRWILPHSGRLLIPFSAGRIAPVAGGVLILKEGKVV